jgi:hypothetical protein
MHTVFFDQAAFNQQHPVRRIQKFSRNCNSSWPGTDDCVTLRQADARSTLLISWPSSGAASERPGIPGSCSDLAMGRREANRDVVMLPSLACPNAVMRGRHES